ncbi:MAG TPA: hypothetical protein VF743_00700 [Acidimicrobiales bacterium]
MIDLLHNLINEALDLVTAGVVLMAIVMVVATWARTRAFVPTIGAIVFGAFVIWAVNNVDFIEEQIGEDIVEESGLPAAGASGGFHA